MAHVEQYQTLIKSALQEYAEFLQLPPQPSYKVALALDDDHRQYVLRKIGWRQKNRLRQTVLHLSIYNDKIWIEEDWTEAGIATYLLKHGVPPEDIVLGFQPPQTRQTPDVAMA